MKENLSKRHQVLKETISFQVFFFLKKNYRFLSCAHHDKLLFSELRKMFDKSRLLTLLEYSISRFIEMKVLNVTIHLRR